MMKNNFSTIIEYGSTSIRLGVFGENFFKLHFSSNNIIEKDNYEEHSKIINILIKDAEKKISNHLENIILLYDSPNIFSIDLSIKRDFDQKTFINDIYASIILEANQLIKNNYIKNKILHVVAVKNIIDGKEIIGNLKNNLEANSVIIEIKFICIPKEIYNKILNNFKKNNLQILNFFCSSYVKSFFYVNSFNKKNLINFLDIGFERSTLITFENKKLMDIKSIPIGGNHITKDISNVLELSIEESEKIKKSFNKSENEFSYKKDINENNELAKEILEKSISVDLLKKVILSRIEEIFDLIFEDPTFIKNLNNKNSILVLTGNGSKLFNKNSFHLNQKYSFEEISFYEENVAEICEAGLNFELNSDANDIKIITKNPKKPGFFENFFNFFGR